jgi:molybdopterin converting factor small subunit
MSHVDPPPADAVLVRYWAGARAAAGRAEDVVPAGMLDEVLGAALAHHAGNARLHSIVAICSVLVGADPVGSRDFATVPVPAGSVVEILPPFAGG